LFRINQVELPDGQIELELLGVEWSVAAAALDVDEIVGDVAPRCSCCVLPYNRMRGMVNPLAFELW
jgi:hypothetical protein